MEKINYPLIGLVVVEADHEENYIFTETEFERVSFPKARKIILSDEPKLTGFIHGRYNARNKNRDSPDWYWTNISSYPPARSNTFNKVVDALDLCRMNVLYNHNHGELPLPESQQE